jgi:hypothetical protein
MAGNSPLARQLSLEFEQGGGVVGIVGFVPVLGGEMQE